jgi:hypothetical protein
MYGESTNTAYHYFIINISNDFLINKKLNKKYIELFEITMKSMVTLALQVSAQGPANGCFERYSTFSRSIHDGIKMLEELYGKN